MNESRAQIDALTDDYFRAFLTANPTEAHLLGDYDYAGQVENYSRVSEDQRIAELGAFIARAEAISDDDLDDDRRVSKAVLLTDATTNIDVLSSRLREIPADPIFGLQASMDIVAGMLAIPTPEVAAAMVDTVRGLGNNYDQLAQRTREGAAAGRYPAQFAVADTITQVEALLATPAEQSTLLASLQPAPDGVEAEQWRGYLDEAVEQHLKPGLTAYADALREVLPLSRPDDKVGLTWLDGGDDAYAATLRYFTTTNKSAQEIHDIGLAQVEKLAEEYRALGPEVVGTDDLHSIFEAMRNDPVLHFTEGQQLVTAAEVAMQRAWDAMPQWFDVLPQAPCVVQATESGAKAFYFPPASDGSRGGTFFINIDDPTSWGTFELEAMAFHEGIPGHHLQLAIAGELTTIPEFRKHLFNSAYAEGWGLYTERLADEMGLYSGPVDRMGMYAADSMRATRLVVDTGIHALGWSRQQAVDYMLTNSPLAEGVVRPEIDRYIVSPGQATSYMIGRLEILRMRAEAEQRLGQDFDIKAFHSAVLDCGSVPLDVLDAIVARRLAR